MNKHEVVAIGVRFFAIYIAVYTLSELIKETHLYLRGMRAADFILLLVIMLFLTAVVVLLWHFSSKIARFIIPSPASSDEPSGISSAWVEPLAFTVLGLFILSSAIPAVFQSVIRIHLYSIRYIDGHARSPSEMASMVSTIVKLMIGLWLIFGAKGLKGLFSLLRTAGQQKKIS